MAKVGVFGGTFDPIHNGHLVAAEGVLTKLKLDKILFVPTGQSWQKSSESDAQIRVEMLRLAIKNRPNFELSLVDVTRPGATYTVDTLSEIQNERPDDELWFILGSDALAGIATWRNFEKLFQLAKFAVVTRPGFPVAIPAQFADQIQVCEIPALNLSATEIRERRAHRESIADLVPAEVANYIEAHKLYEVKA